MASRHVSRIVGLLSICLIFGASEAVFPTTDFTMPHGPFYLRSYLGKCLSYGPWNDPVYPGDRPRLSLTSLYIDICASKALPAPDDSQQVIAVEINGRHDIVLEAGAKVVGLKDNRLQPGTALELQDYSGASGQIWAFDGDTLMLAGSRQLVAEVFNGRTPRGTPVVLGRRDVDDSEFWTFVPVGGGYVKPTNGFVRVPEEKDLRSALLQATEGTVIQIADGAEIALDDCSSAGSCSLRAPVATFPLYIPKGVTVRGSRRGMAHGPHLTVSTFPSTYTIFETRERNVRITGLWLEGPSLDDGWVCTWDPVLMRETCALKPELRGIQVGDEDSPIVDQNEILGVTGAAVGVSSYIAPVKTPDSPDYNCETGVPERGRTARVFRNFLHHNMRDGLGYGVVTGWNAFVFVQGNTFWYNRHQIAADGLRGTGYRAWFNLVLSDAPEYGLFNTTEHDFDMHGAEFDDDSHHTGGIAGSDVDIAWNTFLGKGRYQYDLRGVPCGQDRFRGNITRQYIWDSIHFYGEGYPPPAAPPPYLEVSSNRFSSADPTRRLASGDFDGDGTRDLFLATGASWYYAPGGVGEWRFLNNISTTVTDLLFGDVDGDGRTDVVSKAGSQLRVSWAGTSRSESLHTSAGALADFALVDLNDDGKADLFYAPPGVVWKIAHGCLGPLANYASIVPSRSLKEIRFGDFNGNGRTDIFWIMGGQWYVWLDSGSVWSILQPALTSNIDDVIVADFDGNDRSDIARANSISWDVSYDGVGNWQTLRLSPFTLKNAVAVGRFDHAPGDDVLHWNWNGLPGSFGKYLEIYAGGSAHPERHSRHDLR